MFKQERIKEIIKNNFNTKPIFIKRLLTGLCHYVYHVQDIEKNDYIVRISDLKNRNTLRGSIFWINVLKNYNFPIPKILAEDINGEIPYLVLNYIPGDDLGNVYTELSEISKMIIAKKMVIIQKGLENSINSNKNRYGYLTSFEDNNFKNCWLEVIQEHIKRSRSRIANNLIFDGLYVDKVEEKINEYKEYLNKVRALPFFDDATTKNVLVKDGKLSGIIDIDNICFGDKLYQIALTKMSLLSNNYDTNYINYWIEKLNVTNEELKILDLYTLIFCVDFMSEIGMKFNKEDIIKPDREKINRLEIIFDNAYNTL